MTYEAHFISEHWKVYVDSKNFSKLVETSYKFLDKLIGIGGNCKFSLLLLEYSKLAVHVLTSGPKISNLIKNNTF